MTSHTDDARIPTLGGPQRTWEHPEVGVRIERVTTRAQLQACWSVRLDVFVGEQRVPINEEIDDLDLIGTTIHVLAVDAATGRDLGTARLLRSAKDPGEVHVGRMAVRREARGRNVGAAVMRAVEDLARDERLGGDGAVVAGDGPVVADDGPVRSVLSAQEQAMGFYRRLGYEVVTGERYLDAGIWHQDMAKVL